MILLNFSVLLGNHFISYKSIYLKNFKFYRSLQPFKLFILFPFFLLMINIFIIIIFIIDLFLVFCYHYKQKIKKKQNNLFAIYLKLITFKFFTKYIYKLKKYKI